MSSYSVVLILGTRPEAIKLQPVADALKRRALTPTLVFTGQHPELDPSAYGLGDYPLIRLRCRGQENPYLHVKAVTRAVLPVLAADPPDLALVQGDTSSALGGALAAASAGVPLAHVEAGLRSHSRRQPWPEEEFRIAIDRECELLFAPTELSAANLARERVSGRIHVTGNSGIDALQRLKLQRLRRSNSGPPRLLVTCHRRENWGEALDRVAAALRQVAAERLASIEVVLHPNPALRARLGKLLSGEEAITLAPPRSHAQMVASMLDADLVLSDSGGMQEEASALGVPLLMLRDTTERPEAIASGWVEAVGTGVEPIVSAVRRRVLSRQGRVGPPQFGDGRAGERIAAIIDAWLREKDALSPRYSAVPRTAASW